MQEMILLIAIVGAIAGFTSGATSVGYGTLVILPLLFFGIDAQLIVAAVLVSVTIISLFAGLLHWKDATKVSILKSSTLRSLIIGGVIGAYLGSKLSITHLSEPTLKLSMAVIVLLGGIFYFIRSRTTIRFEAGKAQPWIILCTAFLGGLSTGALGLGWGYITVPSLIFLGVNTTELIGGSLLARAFMSAGGAVNYLKMTTPEMLTIIFTLTIAGTLAAWGGVYFSKRFEPQRVRKALMSWIMALAGVLITKTVWSLWVVT